MCSKGNRCALMVGMEIGTAITENTAGGFKSENRRSYHSAILLLGKVRVPKVNEISISKVFIFMASRKSLIILKYNYFEIEVIQYNLTK